MDFSRKLLLSIDKGCKQSEVLRTENLGRPLMTLYGQMSAQCRVVGGTVAARREIGKETKPRYDHTRS